MSTEIRRRSTLSTLFKSNNNVFMINLICPDNTTITNVHSIRDTVRDVINRSCKKLDINRAEIFGIALYENNEYRFISQKKTLNKFLPSATILTSEQAKELNDINTSNALDRTIKTCRLYLRVRHFYINIEDLSDKTLFHYYEQVRLDILKFQNWLNLYGYNNLFMQIAAKSLWLSYGIQASKVIENNEKPLHYFLPQCEKKSDTKTILLDILKEMHKEFDTYDVTSDDVDSPASNYDYNKNQVRQLNFVKIPDITIDSKPDSIYHKESVMISAIKCAMQLPFYGMYFYHVKSIEENNTTHHNCKLGIGPFGISIALSLNFTTWEEMENWDWSSVEEIDYEKNILDIYEDLPNVKETKLHQFECLNEREAKYLFKQLRESHLFHIKVLEKHKTKVEKKRTNSVGVYPTGELAALVLLPEMTKSNSLTSLYRPRSTSAVTMEERKKQLPVAHCPLTRTKSS